MTADPPDLDRASGPEARIEGPEGAPLVVVHADLSCPDCALAMHRLQGLPLRIDLRHFVLRARGVPAQRAADAVEAAAAQACFWPFAWAMLRHQGRQELPDLWALAEQHGLDVDRFEADRRDRIGRARIEAETNAALRGGATSVPAIFAAPAATELLASQQVRYDGLIAG